MTIFESLKLNEKLLLLLSTNGIEIKDINYLPLYEEYQQMKEEGEKVNYIVAKLAEHYDIGERTVWRLVKKFGETFELSAG